MQIIDGVRNHSPDRKPFGRVVQEMLKECTECKNSGHTEQSVEKGITVWEKYGRKRQQCRNQTYKQIAEGG